MPRAWRSPPAVSPEATPARTPLQRWRAPARRFSIRAARAASRSLSGRKASVCSRRRARRAIHSPGGASTDAFAQRVRYDPRPCGKSCGPAAHSCGRSFFARSRLSASSSNDSGRCSASACCRRISSRRSPSSPTATRSIPRSSRRWRRTRRWDACWPRRWPTAHRGREIMMERVEDTGRHVVHELERFLNSLGTIASISPLLGLLGTVMGIIRAFNAVMLGGMGDPRMLAGGISEALVTTAGGLAVAIPVVHRVSLPARQGRTHRDRDGKDRRELRRFARRRRRSPENPTATSRAPHEDCRPASPRKIRRST